MWTRVDSANLTARDQTTIPKEVPEHMRLRPGDRVDFFLQGDGTVLLVSKRIHVADLKGILKATRHVSLAGMDRAIRRNG